jgi:hypothetical protein
MILEGIVTTLGADDQAHIAAMGATVPAVMESLMLRPFRSSATYENLRRRMEGVFHVTDDVELIVQAALGRWSVPVATAPVPDFPVPRLVDCCRWYAFQVRDIDHQADRATMQCRVVKWGRQRDFWGFNRAKHAVLELAIMATRIHLLPSTDIMNELERTRVIVDKTGGIAETRALAVMAGYISECRPRAEHE